MKFKVVDVEEIEGDIVIYFNSVNERGKAMTKGKNSWFIELWRPKVLGLCVKKGDIFEIDFTPIK
jgi:hypothetical protein